MAVPISCASARIANARLGGAAFLLTLLLTLLVAAPAGAAPPAATLDKQAPERQLFGTDAQVTLHAESPDGQPWGYNLTFRDVLPAGVSYVTGSAPIDPRVIADAPSAGQTTLLWENVSDLSPNSSYELPYKVHHSTTLLDVGQTYTNQASAYLHEDPRFIPKFTAAGVPIVDPRVSAASDSAATLITAIEIEKDEPSPEGELLRGVHDHKTVYTLTLRNNEINPTTGVTVDDWLPAGLEYLACATEDNGAVEFPGAPPLDASAPAAPDCRTPSLVETVLTDPDGGGPLGTGVYTHVRWTAPNLAPNEEYVIQYIAAIPIFENRLDFGGFTPSPESGQQAANLDNNDGAETFDEQALTNFARVNGTYDGSTVVFDDDTITRTAEDIAIQKTVDTPKIEQGGPSVWKLEIEASEYRSVANIRVTDTLPDGLCPIDGVNHEEVSQSAECNPQPGELPSLPYTSVDERPDGSFVLDWIAPDLAPNGTTTITFPTRARASYQENYVDDPGKPVLTRDRWTNEVRLVGTDSTPSGIPHDELDGTDDFDESKASQEAGEITIDKTIRQPDGSIDCDTGTYSDALAATYGPGDRVCWRVKVTFPGPLDTGSPKIVDFLPPGSEFEADSLQYLQTTGAIPRETLSPGGPLEWDWSTTTEDIESGGLVFEAQFSTILGGPEHAAAGDILGNLQKVMFANSTGTTFPLRDQVDFEYAEAELGLVKGVGDVNDVPTSGPDVDGVEVSGGDVVTYRLDIEEKGGRAAQEIEVWDLLPDGITCGEVSNVSPGGGCAGDRVTWTGRSVAALGSTTLTYDVEMPTTFGPEAQLVNRAGVRGYQSTSNIGNPVAYVPANNIDTAHPDTPNAPPAADDSDVLMRAVTVDKTRTTEVGESGNALANQATIGEEIDYEITTTIPSGTTLYGTPVFADTLGAGQTFQPGSLTVTLDGVNIIGNPSYLIASGPSGVTVTFPSTYANPSGDDELIVRFTTQVDDVAGNVRGDDLANTAKLTFSDAASGGNVHEPSDTVTTRIVEPNLRVTKADNDADDRVIPGQDITYTVTASQAAGADRSRSHDTVMVDVVPVGLTPQPGSLGDGVWDPTPGVRTITWDVGTLETGGTFTRTYVARVDDPAAAATEFPNTVTLTGSSLDAAHEAGGERTAGSTTNAGYTASATRTLQIAAAVVDKSVAPTTATVGDRLVYTVDVMLRANVNYPDVVLLDTLPDGIDFGDTVSVTCLDGCGLGAAELPAAPQGDGSTRLGWWIGDAGTDTDDRTVRIVYSAHVDDQREPEATPIVTGNTLVNGAQAAYNSVEAVPGTPLEIPDAGDFDERSNLDTATVTVAEPAITLDKGVSGDADDDDARETQPGDTYTYTLRVRNSGTAPAHDVRVIDQPDDDLLAVTPTTGAGMVTDGWTALDPDLVWVIPGPIAPGATVTLAYTADLGPTSGLSDGETIANTADVTEFYGVPEAQRTADAFDYRRYTVVPADTVTLTVDLPQLVVNKTTDLTATPDTGDAEIGQAFPWRITVTNTASTATAHDVSLTDVLPADWAVVPGSASPAPTSTVGGTLTWTDVTDLAPGQSAVFTLAAVPSEAAAAAADPQVNTATATADDASGVGGYTDVDTASATLLSPTLELTKTPDAAQRNAGAATNWTVQISNTGDGAARNVVIDDTLPAGVTYTPGSATATPSTGFSETSASGASIGWEIAELAAGATVDITVPVTLDADLTSGTILTNSAEAHADEASTPVSDTGSFEVTTEADVGITKVGDVAAIEAGLVLEYTLTATNAGPSDAQAVTVTDVLPAEVVLVDAEAPCTDAAGTVTCALGTLAAGDSHALTVRVRVLPGVTGTVENTATITTTTDDPDPTDDEDTETTTIGTSADVSLTKTAAAPEVLRGGTVAFTLQVRNDGPSDAVGVAVADPLPAGASFVTAGSDSRCTEAGGIVTCAVGVLGESATTDLVVVLRLDDVGTLVNTATASSTTPDPDTTDLTDDATVEVAPATDLAVEKTGPASVEAGGEATYTLTARNAGPNDATGVAIVDALPAGTRFVDSVPPGACDEVAGEVTCPVGDLANGAEHTVDVRVEVPKALADQQLLNTATVDGNEGDPDLTDNTATAPTTVGPAVDLRVTKVTPGAVAGGDVTWTIGVVNAGPSTATAVTLEDPLPAGVTFIGASAGQGSCALDGTTVRCALGTLPRHGAAQVTITARVGGDGVGTALSNTATATAHEPETEPVDNAATATVTVAAPVPDRVALELTKTATTTTPRLGKPFSYVIRARNTGAVDAPAVVVTDALAAPLDLVSALSTQGTCEQGRVVRCVLGTIPPGAEASVTVRVVPRRAGAVRNLATVDSAGAEASPDGLSAVAGVKVSAKRTRLRLAKRALRNAVRAGGKVRFAITVRNGRRAAQDVRVCDTLPAAMALVSARGAKLRNGRPCWQWKYLPARAKRVVHVTVRVAPGTVRSSVRNTATAKARNAGRRRAADRVRVRPRAVRGGGVTG